MYGAMWHRHAKSTVHMLCRNDLATTHRGTKEDIGNCLLLGDRRLQQMLPLTLYERSFSYFEANTVIGSDYKSLFRFTARA